MIQILITQFNTWDVVMCRKIFGWNGRRIRDFSMLLFSRFGDGYAYGVFGLLAFLFDRYTALRILPAALLSFPLELIIQKLVKHTLKRPRPCHSLPDIHNLISLPDDFSFPSGHTASAFLMATLVSHAYGALAIPVHLIAALIGLSRIYNGVHYPSDVLAGSVLGLGCAHLALFLF